MKKLSLVLVSIFSVLLCGLLTACGKTFEVKFTEGECVAVIGQEINLDSLITVKNGNKKDVEFKFSNPALFSVQGKTAKAENCGKGYIYAYYKSQNLASKQVIVKDKFAAPTGFNIENDRLLSQDGKLKWNTVSGAFDGKVYTAKYEISGTCDGQPIFDGKKKVLDKNEFDFSQVENKQGKYEFEIKAAANDYFVESEAANVVVYYNYALPATNISWKNGEISWQKEDGYTYQVVFDGQKIGDFADISTLNISNEFKTKQDGKSYEVKIISHSPKGELLDRESETLAIEKLTAPTVSFSDGQMQLENAKATSFSLLLENGDEVPYENSTLKNFAAGSHQVKAIAKNLNGLYFESSPSEAVSIFKLDKLQIEYKGAELNAQVLNADVTSSSAPFETSFVIMIEGLDDVTKDGFVANGQNKSIEIPVSQSGNYNISIYQKGNLEQYQGAYIICSDPTEEVTISKFDKISNFAHSYDFENKKSIITFANVGAANYEIRKSDDSVIKRVSGTDDQTVTVELDTYLEDLISGNEIKIVALAADEKLSISSSEPITFERLAQVEVKSKDNTSFKVEWNAVNNANGYLVEYHKFSSKQEYDAFENDVTFEVTSEIVYTTSFEFDEEGYYYFSVKALPQNTNGFLSSSKSQQKLIVAKTVDFGTLKFKFDETEITEERSGYFLEITPQADGHVVSYTFSGTNLTISSKEDGNRYYIGKIQAGEYNLTITANSGDEQVYLAATKTLKLQKLPTVTYGELKVDEAGVLLKVAQKTGESQTIIKNDNPDEQTVNGQYKLPKKDEINLSITRKGTQSENGEFDIVGTIYLDSETAALKFKRVEKSGNLKYDSTSKQILLTSQSIANRKYWALDIIGENATLSVKLDTSVVTTLNGEEFTVGNGSDYIHEEGNSVKIEIGKILTYIKSQPKLFDFYTQENDLSFAVYAHQNRTLTDYLEISSLYALAESNPSQDYIKIPKLPAAKLSFNKETMNLEWTNVSEDAGINAKTTYKLYYQKNEDAEQEIQHSSSNYNCQDFEFDAGATYKFYVKASNPEFLDESVSNEIYLQKLQKISTLTLNENNLIFTILDDKTHYSEVKFVYNNAEEQAESVKDSSVIVKGEGSYKFTVVGTSIGDTYFYLDSDESVWTVSKMEKLVEESPVSVTFNGNVISFSKFPTSISSLQYLIRFTDKNNYSYSIITKETSIDLSQNEEILNEISKLSAGKIKIGVYASLGTYSVSLGNIIYYAENIEGVGYNYYSYVADSLEKEIEKFATPEIESVEFVYQNQSEQERYLEDAQTPKIKVTFKGNYGESGKFKIFVGENEVTTEVSYSSGDDGIGLYTFTLENSDYANAGASGKVKIAIYALNIEENASAIPSSAGLLIIDKAQTFSGISFEETEEGYLTENLLLNYSQDAPQPLDGIVLKITYTPVSSEQATKYILASQDLDLNAPFKVSLADFIAENLKEGGTIDKISAFVNSGAKNKTYILAGEPYETQQPFTILKQVKQDNIEAVSEGFKISPEFNSENTIYKVTVTTEGSSGVYYLNTENEFTFTFPDIWSDNTYNFTVEAFESGKVSSAISEELSISLERIDQITKSSITLTRGTDNQLSLSWGEVSQASGYIINVYTQEEQDRKLVYSFNTAENGSKTEYKVEEIFGTGYLNLREKGMMFIENQDIVLGFVTIGSSKQNSKEVFVNSQIKGNSILENNIKVDEFGVLYFDVNMNETYLYKIETTSTHTNDWKSKFASTDTIKVNTDEMDAGKPFNITIMCKGGVDNTANAEQANFIFDSASYTTAETGYTFSKTDQLRVIQDENSPQNLNFSVLQTEGFGGNSKLKDGAKIFVGASENDLLDGLAKLVETQISLSGDITYANIPEIVASLQKNVKTLYFWQLNQTLSKDQTFVSSSAATFTIKLDQNPITYKVSKGKYMQGEQILVEDYINTYITLDNTDSSTLKTQGFYIKITQLDEEFTIFKFIAKDKLLQNNYFNDSEISSKVFENNFVINLTEIFDGSELLGKAGKFSISLLKLYTENGVCVISDWTEIDHPFTRLVEISNLGLNLGEISWRGADESSYVIYFYEVDAEHEKLDPTLGFNYDTLVLSKYFLTDFEKFNPNAFIGDKDRYFIAVRTINKENINALNEYVLSSGRIFTLEQGIPSYHYKNVVKTPLALDDAGRLSFAWKDSDGNDSDFITFLKQANGEGDANQLATSTFTVPFTFTLADLVSQTFLFRFTPYSEPNGFTYEIQVRAIDLLDDYTKAWDGIKDKLNRLQPLPQDTANRDIISNFISAINNASKGVGYDQKLFDTYFEKVQKGDYKLMYSLQGNARRFNSGWYTFLNKDKEDKLYVNEEPDVKIVQVNSLSDASITDDAVNAYKVVLKKAKVYVKGGDLPDATVYRMVLGTNTFVISLGAMSVQLDGEDGDAVTLYNCDFNGRESSVLSEYVMFYLNYSEKSLLALYGDKIFRTSYTMQIYVVGNEYSAASKSEEFKIFFLDLKSLSVQEGEITWNASDARPVTIFAKHSTSTATDKFTEREKFSLEDSKAGLWDLRLFVKGEVVNNDVYVDTDIYKLSVYKLEAPSITTKLGNLVVTNDSNNIEILKNAASTDKDKFKYRLFNDVSTAINYITLYKNDETALEYEAGLAGIEESNSQYLVKEKEKEASIFYAMSIGSTVNLKAENSAEPKGYYDKTLLPDSEDLKDKMIVLSSASKPREAKMLDDVDEDSLQIENGVVTWGSVAGKGASVAKNIVYKVTLETYTKSTVGNVTTETTTGKKASYYTAKTTFDIAFVKEISLPNDEGTFIKVTVQALSVNSITLEDGQSVPQESKDYALVEGGAYLDVKSQNTYNEEANNYVLMSDRVSIKDIKRLDAIEEIEVATDDEGKSTGYLTWRYKANGILTVEDFKKQIGFEVYDDEYNFVAGEFDIKKVDDTFVVVFKDFGMKAGKFTMHVYVTQGEGSEDEEIKAKLIKSYSTDVEITKLAKITENDYEVRVQTDGKEELSFENYFKTHADDIIILKWNDSEERLTKDKVGIDISSILVDSLDIQFKVVRDISADQANRDKILFSDENKITFVRPKWNEQDSITWERTEQRYEWTYTGDGKDSEDLTFYIEIEYAGSDARTYVTQNSYFTPNVIGTINRFSVKAKINNSSVLSNALEYIQEEQFNLFKSGDGTPGNPYIIETSDQFKNIIYRLNKDVALNNYTKIVNADAVSQTEAEVYYFKLIDDLTIDDVEGFVISGQFNGVLDGQNEDDAYTITFTSKNVRTLASQIADNNSYMPAKYNQASALFETLFDKAEIKNLKISANFDRASNLNSNALMAGLAITNYGKVTNVNLVGFTSNFASSVGSGQIASLAYSGLVAYNLNSISNCNVLTSISLRDKSTTAHNIYLAGISYINAGTITYCTAGKATDTHEERFEFRVDLTAATSSVLIGGITIVSTKTIQNCHNECVIVANGTANDQAAYLAGISVKRSGTFTDNTNNYSSYLDQAGDSIQNPRVTGSGFNDMNCKVGDVYCE